jgi:hypothetical protein
MWPDGIPSVNQNSANAGKVPCGHRKITPSGRLPNVSRRKRKRKRPKLPSGPRRTPNPQIAARCRDLALISSHPHHKPVRLTILRLPLRHEREFSEKKLRKLCDRSAELGNREIVTGRSKQIYNRQRQFALTLRCPFHRTGQGGGASADVPAGSRFTIAATAAAPTAWRRWRRCGLCPSQSVFAESCDLTATRRVIPPQDQMLCFMHSG